MGYGRRTKAYSNGGVGNSGFYPSVITNVASVDVAGVGTYSSVRVTCDRLGKYDVGPYPNVGPVPSVGDSVWISFQENDPDELLVFNPAVATFSWDGGTLHVNTINDAVLFNTTTAVLDGGGTEYHPVVIQAKDSIWPAVKIIPGSTVNTTRASMLFHKTIMGAGSGAGDEGDWYVYDVPAEKWNLHHTGHSNTTTGGLTIRSTGLSERYLQLCPAYVSGGSEWSAIFRNNANVNILMNGTLRPYSILPYVSGSYNLGSAGIQWQDIYLVNNPIVSSDQNYKTDIVDSNLGLDFINDLRPVSFKFLDGGIRTHYGLIAQEVEAVLGADASDTAIWTKETIEASPEIPADEYLPGQPAVEEHVKQSLRYTELMAPMIKAIQQLTARVAALEGQ